MVRSSRSPLALAAALPLILLAACGGEPTQGLQLSLERPAVGTHEIPTPLGVVRGTAKDAETLTLKISAGDETYTFSARPGATMAFRLGVVPLAPPVRLEGLAVEPPPPSEVLRAFEERLSESVPTAVVRRPEGEDAFVVDLPVDREEHWPAIVRSTGVPADLRFLVEVLPREAYRPGPGGRVPARLEAPPYPWDGSGEAFSTFKEKEVVRWQKTIGAGRPYGPSRAGLLVLPRMGTKAATAEDFAVLEWPAEAEHRFDGRMLDHPVTSRDPQTGQPVVLYEIREAYRDAFEAWTKANVGLPLAIVHGWVVQSAPTINSALRDNVQISLGQGSYAELEAQANVLTSALSGRQAGPSAVLVAVCTWQRDGSFEVLLPLAERRDTRLLLESRGVSSAERGSTSITLRHVPGIDAAPRDVVDACLAEMCLDGRSAASATPQLEAAGAAAVERLSEIAGGEGTPVRRLLAADLLGRVDPGADLARSTLVALVDGEDAERAVVAAGALRGAAAEHDDAFEALFRAAAASDPVVRRAALHSLQGVKSERREELLSRLDDEDLAVRQAVFLTLGEFGVDGDGDWESWLLPAYLSRLKDADPGMRHMAVTYLNQLESMGANGVKEHAGEIAALLADESAEVRFAVAGCLGSFGNDVLAVLSPYLTADRKEVRAAALGALVGIEEPSEAVSASIEAGYDDPALQVRLIAASALAMRGGDLARALPVAREGLESTDEVERRLALGIVWWAADRAPEAAPWLEPLLEDADEMTRVLAAAALKRMDRETDASRKVLSTVRADPAHPMHGFARSLEEQAEAVKKD